MNILIIYDEDVSREDHIEAMQELINSGDAWRLEGAIGRDAMGLIESGDCMLGEQGHMDFWGNYVPSRYQVKAGTMGSAEFCEDA